MSNVFMRDYERFLKEEHSKKAITSQLKVGEWFRINREMINKSKEEIHRKCNEVGSEGEKLWKRFEESNKIANENPDQYPYLIETYVFKHIWKRITEQKMRDICEVVGDGSCCEVICDLELQMRICNGELVNDLVKKADKLPHARVIKLRNGGTGYFGGGAAHHYDYPPANLDRVDFEFEPNLLYCVGVPYAFRRVPS